MFKRIASLVGGFVLLAGLVLPAFAAGATTSADSTTDARRSQVQQASFGIAMGSTSRDIACTYLSESSTVTSYGCSGSWREANPNGNSISTSGETDVSKTGGTGKQYFYRLDSTDGVAFTDVRLYCRHFDGTSTGARASFSNVWHVTSADVGTAWLCSGSTNGYGNIIHSCKYYLTYGPYCTDVTIGVGGGSHQQVIERWRG
jgi:hypothetical protein